MWSGLLLTRTHPLSIPLGRARRLQGDRCSLDGGLSPGHPQHHPVAVAQLPFGHLERIQCRFPEESVSRTIFSAGTGPRIPLFLVAVVLTNSISF